MLRIPFFIQVQNENILLSSLFATIFLMQFSKESSSISQYEVHKFYSITQYIGYGAIGAFIGIALNQFFSVSYLTNLSVGYTLLDLLIVTFGLVSFYLIARSTKKPNEKTRHAFLSERIRYVFLGISLISVLYASWFFIYLVRSYLSILSQAEATGATINADPSLFINIFKSLLLTGLFSFLERLVRVYEDTSKSKP